MPARWGLQQTTLALPLKRQPNDKLPKIEKRTDCWTHFTKAGWAWHVTICILILMIPWTILIMHSLGCNAGVEIVKEILLPTEKYCRVPARRASNKSMGYYMFCIQLAYRCPYRTVTWLNLCHFCHAFYLPMPVDWTPVFHSYFRGWAHRAGQKNIVVSYNLTDPCQKPPTQKFFWDFWSKTVVGKNFRHVFNQL